MNFAILLNGKEQKVFAVSKTDGRLIFDAIEKLGTALTVTRSGTGTATRHIPTPWIQEEPQGDDGEEDMRQYEAQRNNQ